MQLMVNRKTLGIVVAGLIVGILGGVATNSSILQPGQNGSSDTASDGSSNLPTALYDVDTASDWQRVTSRFTFRPDATGFENGRMRIAKYGEIQLANPLWMSVAAIRAQPVFASVQLDTLTAEGYLPADSAPPSQLALHLYECNEEIARSTQFRENCERVYSYTQTDPGTVTLQEDLSNLSVGPALMAELVVSANTTESLPQEQEAYWDSFKLTRQP